MRCVVGRIVFIAVLLAAAVFPAWAHAGFIVYDSMMPDSVSNSSSFFIVDSYNYAPSSNSSSYTEQKGYFYTTTEGYFIYKSNVSLPSAAVDAGDLQNALLCRQCSLLRLHNCPVV
jgi:hypothetical protein